MENRGIEIVERIEINELNFPDVIFREEYVRKFDKDKDGYLSNEEMNEVTDIDVSFEKNIINLTGIEYFKNLITLDCCYTGITDLNVSENKALKKLYCSSTGITELDIRENKDLKKLYCSDVKISSLDSLLRSFLRMFGFFC